jgi:hypothetical protein
MQVPGSYLLATRHPWPCFLFLLPMLVAYEGGVVWLGGTQPEALRNGAHTWLLWALESFGLYQLYWAPVLLACVFLMWSCVRWFDKPEDLLGVVSGMVLESVAFALGLWGISRALSPLLHEWGIRLDTTQLETSVGQVITYVGAGIYEEALFRLLLFTALGWGLRHLFGAPVAFLISSLASAAIFSAAHHVGPHGEPFDNLRFLFRALAGLYFVLLLQLRGFGIAVGAHACYDIMVGAVVG